MPRDISGRSPPVERNRFPAANGTPDLNFSNTNNSDQTRHAEPRPAQRRLSSRAA